MSFDCQSAAVWKEGFKSKEDKILKKAEKDPAKYKVIKARREDDNGKIIIVTKKGKLKAVLEESSKEQTSTDLTLARKQKTTQEKPSQKVSELKKRPATKPALESVAFEVTTRPKKVNQTNTGKGSAEHPVQPSLPFISSTVE